jgi:type VI secretion system protein ImpB
MPSASQQHTLDRVRRPRVQITYDVEIGDAQETIELPFVVGVMADLSAQGGPKNTDGTPKVYKDREFVDIDRDNFNEVLERQAPRLAMKVPDKITGKDQKIAVELNFKHLDDFEPARVARQVGPLKELLETRQRLEQLLSKMEGNDKLEGMLAEVLSSNEKALEMAKQLGIEAAAGESPANPEEPK